MTFRIADVDVQPLIEWDSVEVPVLTPFIEAAEQLVNDVLSGQGYTDTKMAVIEKWLAAHFYHVRVLRVRSDRTGNASARVTEKVGLGLDQTEQGQMVKILDTSGLLAQLDRRAQGKGYTAEVVSLEDRRWRSWYGRFYDWLWIG